jgi:hypothetical protein
MVEVPNSFRLELLEEGLTALEKEEEGAAASLDSQRYRESSKYDTCLCGVRSTE